MCHGYIQCCISSKINNGKKSRQDISVNTDKHSVGAGEMEVVLESCRLLKS